MIDVWEREFTDQLQYLLLLGHFIVFVFTLYSTTEVMFAHILE